MIIYSTALIPRILFAHNITTFIIIAEIIYKECKYYTQSDHICVIDILATRFVEMQSGVSQLKIELVTQ